MSPANNDASFAILAVRAPLNFFALRSEIVNTFPILSVHSFERRSCLILSHPLSPLVRAPLMSERICVQRIMDVLKSVLMTLAQKYLALDMPCSWTCQNSRICVLLVRTFVHSMVALFVVRQGLSVSNDPEL